MRPTTAVEVAHSVSCELGEGLLWDVRVQRLLWVDILRGRLHALDPRSGALDTVSVGQPVGAVVPRRRGGWMLAVQDGFAALDALDAAVALVAPVEAGDADRRMNDGACDAAGRFWAGTMALDGRPGAGSLYRLDPDGRVQVMLRDVTVSNGIDWSLDGRQMYFADTGIGRIDVFEFDADTGQIGGRRPFVEVDTADGSPDGLTVDREGGIWVALWGGGAVRRYWPDGTLDRTLTLPTRHPTNCAFGGADLEDLYITTASIELTAAERARQPLAGALLRHRPGVAGRLPHAFAG